MSKSQMNTGKHWKAKALSGDWKKKKNLSTDTKNDIFGRDEKLGCINFRNEVFEDQKTSKPPRYVSNVDSFFWSDLSSTNNLKQNPISTGIQDLPIRKTFLFFK